MIRNLQGLIRTTAATMLLASASRGEHLEGMPGVDSGYSARNTPRQSRTSSDLTLF